MRTAGGVTTVFSEGVWEQTSAGARKIYYTFNGQTVAMRDSTTGAVTYLHGDHLGSVSASSDGNGGSISRQYFDPWGQVKSGAVSATALNYTGQQLDATGLLYYHARYYNPVLARFVSADSIVPGQSDTLGTANPQNLNRYSYVNNNPVRYNDPSGHCIFALVDTIVCAAVAAEVVEVVVTAVVGAAVIATAYEAGGAIGQAHAAQEQNAAAEPAEDDIPTIVMPHDKYPESVEHLEEAQDAGLPDTGEIDRQGAANKRKQALQGIPTVAGKDRDEYPPAVLRKEGAPVSVKPVTSSDNRGAGSYLGKQLADYPDGTKVRVVSSRRYGGPVTD